MRTEVVMVVEDDRVVSKVLESQLQAEGYEVVCASNGATAVGMVRARRPDVMILDLGLLDDNPGNSLNDGFAFLHYLRWTVPEADFPVIIHTADTSASLEARAAAAGAFAVFPKGDNLQLLVQAVRTALLPAALA
jgi:CheY-like chemotaxis protein